MVLHYEIYFTNNGNMSHARDGRENEDVFIVPVFDVFSEATMTHFDAISVSLPGHATSSDYHLSR